MLLFGAVEGSWCQPEKIPASEHMCVPKRNSGCLLKRTRHSTSFVRPRPSCVRVTYVFASSRPYSKISSGKVLTNKLETAGRLCSKLVKSHTKIAPPTWCAADTNATQVYGVALEWPLVAVMVVVALSHTNNTLSFARLHSQNGQYEADECF